jgi:Fe-S-cluster containining protein
MSEERSDEESACRRCGRCCEKGGPALHVEDLPLIKQGKITVDRLFTIREGERVHDNVRGEPALAAGEIVKVKGRGGRWTCIFYEAEDRRCTLYDSRPLECRLLACEDTAVLERAFEKGRLTRRDVLKSAPALLELVEEHENRCAYRKLLSLADTLAADPRDESARYAVAAMIAYDRHLRDAAVESGRLKADWLDFLFGRPLAETAQGFGLRVRLEKERTVVSLSR